MEQVWTETLEELKFAGVHEIIKRLGNSDAR
jgi:hypothetical protein